MVTMLATTSAACTPAVRSAFIVAPRARSAPARQVGSLHSPPGRDDSSAPRARSRRLLVLGEERLRVEDGEDEDRVGGRVAIAVAAGEGPAIGLRHEDVGGA